MEQMWKHNMSLVMTHENVFQHKIRMKLDHRIKDIRIVYNYVFIM
jgi:hypothetical protein